MTPFPADPVEARGPMRIVLTAYPSAEVAEREVERIVGARLAVCAQIVAVRSRYWWNRRLERAEESLVLFKTLPKRVGALFRAIERGHPYDIPEIVELDVPRVHLPYLDYLAENGRDVRTRTALRARSARVTRPGGRRAPAAHRPARTRARRRHRSRGTGTSR